MKTLAHILLFGVFCLGIGFTQAQNLPSPLFSANFELEKIEKENANNTLKAVLIICDNYASSENNNIAQSVRVDMGTMTQLFNILEKRNILKVEKTILQGTKATKANIKMALQNLQVGNDDVVMVYFSGHGGMQDRKTFLMTADEKDLWRNELETWLKPKNARLKILITDACSNDIDGLSATRSFGKGNQQTESGAYDQIYKDLFLKYQGFMHLSASTEGEYAWSNDNFGGFFTYYFIKEGLIKKPTNDWQEIFKNAKDKTSQMFMRMTAEERSELAQQGIKNQTAKAYSMPNPKNSGNQTDQNTDNDIKPQPDPLPNPNLKGTITVENFTENIIRFTIDNNLPNSEWDASKTQVVRLEAGKKTTIKQAYATISFQANGETLYYELENNSEYFFGLDDAQQIDLFYKEAEVSQENHSNFTKTDYSKLILGRWTWEDAATGDEIVTSFRANNTYSEKYPEETQNGAWTLSRRKIGNSEENTLVFTITDDEGAKWEIIYTIEIDENSPNELQLVFVAVSENGNEIPYAEAEEYFQPTILMSRIVR